MKIKKMSMSTKFLILSLVAIVLTMTLIGVSNIFAEPTIFDLVEAKDIGEFKPSNLYDPEKDEPKLYAWLNMNQIAVPHDMWYDYDEDGNVDVEDVYSVEGFEHHMYMNAQLYPIFQLDEDDEYVVVAMYDYKRYNGVPVEILIGYNSDMGHTFGKENYFFDSESKVLYIKKDLIEKEVEEDQQFVTIRAETVQLIKSMDDFTKKIDVITLFNEDIENTHGLLKTTPNGEYEFNVREMGLSGLKYQLVDKDHLAYASKENLTVWVNETETEEFDYDETTGIITINAAPASTDLIIVKFNDVVDADTASATLQATQKKGETAQAASFSEAGVLTGNNPFLKKLSFEHDAPQVGATTPLTFTYFVYTKSLRNITDTYTSQTYGSVDVATLKYVVDEFKASTTRSQGKTGYYMSTTISAFQTSRGTASLACGKCVYNMFLFAKKGNMDALEEAKNWAIDILQKDDVNHGKNLYSYNGTFVDCWRVLLWSAYKNEGKEYYGRYITGVNIADEANPFLGGVIKEGDGHAFFDVSCAMLNAPEVCQVSNFKKENGNAVHWLSNATITEIDEDYLYVCLWSRTLSSYKSEDHVQRVLAFSRVPYEFNGKGTFTLSKVDKNTQQSLAGAVFELYDNQACTGTPILTIESVDQPLQSEEVQSGTYWLKETKCPTGYKMLTEPVQVVITGGKDVTVVIENEKQQVEFEFTVYDRTTERNPVQVGVGGIKFTLYKPNGEPFGDYITNANGKLVALAEKDSSNPSKIIIPADGEYWLEQTNTVRYYAYDAINSNIRHYYCSKIIVPATPRAYGEEYYGVDYKITDAHFEQRQTVEIESQVCDEHVGVNSKATFYTAQETYDIVNGQVVQTEGTTTSLIGAKYELYAPEISPDNPLFLGYDNNGNKVVITDPNSPLMFEAMIYNGGELVKENARYTISSQIYDVDKSFIKVTKIVHNGKAYDVPNATYQWKMVAPSPGYCLDETNTESDSYKLSITNVEAEWSAKDNEGKWLVHQKKTDPVFQKRQMIEIRVWSKYFEDKLQGSFGTAYRKNPVFYDEPTLNDRGHQILGDQILWHSQETKPGGSHPGIEVGPTTITVSVMKGLYSDNSKLNANTTDIVVVNKHIAFDSEMSGSTHTDTTEVESKGIAENAIYAIVSDCPTVDIATGEVIPKGMVVGVYLPRATIDGEVVEGLIISNKWGSTSFQNPNRETAITTIPNFVALTENNQVTTAALPNGSYHIEIYIPQDGMNDEMYISEDLTRGLTWSEDTWGQETKVFETTTMLYKEITDPQNPDVPVGPEPEPDFPDEPDYPYDPDPNTPNDPDDPREPYDPEDPYDPDYPDDPEDPNDSEDIPLVPRKWVDENETRVAYRIVDSDNVTTTDGQTTHDVSDKLPTTFAFYLKELGVLNREKYTYSFNTWFYYEIDKATYDTHASACSKCGDYDADGNLMECDQYLMKQGICYRRFNAVGEYAGGDYELGDVIALNENSAGYLNLTSLVAENATISGSIYNYSWLNEQLAKQADGTYHILIRVNEHQSWVGVGGQIMERDLEKYGWGVLTIKNRQLFPLD